MFAHRIRRSRKHCECFTGTLWTSTEQRTTQWTPAAMPPTAVSASHLSAEIEQTPVIKWIILLWGEVNKKFQGKKKLAWG